MPRHATASFSFDVYGYVFEKMKNIREYELYYEKNGGYYNDKAQPGFELGYGYPHKTKNTIYSRFSSNTVYCVLHDGEGEI